LIATERSSTGETRPAASAATRQRCPAGSPPVPRTRSPDHPGRTWQQGIAQLMPLPDSRHYNGRRPPAAADSVHPAADLSQQRITPGYPRRHHPRIPESCVKAQVKISGRVLEPTGSERPQPVLSISWRRAARSRSFCSWACSNSGLRWGAPLADQTAAEQRQHSHRRVTADGREQQAQCAGRRRLLEGWPPGTPARAAGPRSPRCASAAVGTRAR
jgi:hypothetical protein